MSNNPNEKRIKEAHECIQKAEEHLKTSIWKLKTKPNYDSAAYDFERAAVCFRNAEKLDDCRDCYLRAAECYLANHNFFHEAKSKESAAMACKDAKDFVKATELFEKSANSYLNSGNMDTAAQIIDRAAKMMEQTSPTKAAELYEKAIDFVQQIDRSKQATAFSHKLISIYLKLDQHENIIRTSKNLIEKYFEIGEIAKIGQIVLALVLVELKFNDSISALKMLSLLPESQISSFELELNAIKSLIRAYEDFDDEKFQECLKSGIWRSLDNDYLRLMRTLKAPKDELNERRNRLNKNPINNEVNEEEEDLR